MGKLHYFTLLLLIILLAVVSGGIFDSIDKTPGKKKQEVKHEPDYFIENFKATSMDSNGQPVYIVKASYLEHFPDDDSMQLKQPVFEYYQDKQKVWQASSETAVYYQKSKTIHFTGNVQFNELKTPLRKENELFTLTANKLTLNIDKNIVKGRSDVVLERQGMKITANRLHADFNDKKITFSSRTHSRYVY